MISSVGEIMSRSLICLDIEASIGEALDVIDRERISQLLIVEERQLVGVISKTDLVHRLTKMVLETTGKTMSLIQLRTIKVSDFMNTNIITVTEEDEISYAVELLMQQKFHCLPVVNEYNEPTGILTSFDFLKGQYVQQSKR